MPLVGRLRGTLRRPRRPDPVTTPGRELPQDPPGAENVEGRRIQSLDDGFGERWFKSFTIQLPGQPDPGRVMAIWKAEFESFWPEGRRFFRPAHGLWPGEVAGMELDAPGGGGVSTGVAVDESSRTSLTLRTPQGHMFAGWIRFSTVPAASGTEARIETEIRPSDPLYQVGLWLGGNRSEDHFWEAVLTAVGRRFGEHSPVSTERQRLSRQFTWRNATNVRYNAGVRTTGKRFFRMILTPWRALQRWV